MVLPAGLVDAETDCAGALVIEGMAEAFNPGDVPYQDTIPIEIRSFGLQSLEPVLLSSGVEELLFITLQSERGQSAADPPPGDEADLHDG